MTGHSAKSLTDEGIEFDTAVYKGRTNAGYYPDHGRILLRVHYDEKSRLILGAQASVTKESTNELTSLQPQSWAK